MTRVVLSIGSNVGDRLASLRSAVDGFGDAVVAVSQVYETAPWGGVEQAPFLNAVVIAEDPSSDARAWLKRGQALEEAAQRVREKRWGPRTLDVDVIACYAGMREITVAEPDFVVPHPRAHTRAFVLVPWLDVDPGAELTVAGVKRPVAHLLADLDAAERAGVTRTGLELL